jgi:hypothetical protein
MIYLLTAIVLSPGGSSTVHIYTETVHRTTQWNRIWYDIFYDMIYYILWYVMIYYMIWYILCYDMKWYDIIYILLTAIVLSPSGSSTVHIYTQTIHRTIQNKQYTEQHNNWKSAGRARSWLVKPWHLPYNRGKSTEKPQLLNLRNLLPKSGTFLSGHPVYPVRMAKIGCHCTMS